LGVVLGLVALGVTAPSGMAMTRWSGSCTFDGYSKFWPTRKWVPEAAGYHYIGTGPCKGTLDGKSFDGKGTLDLYANMKQPMGCSAGASLYNGPGYMVFHTGRKAAPASPAPAQPSAKKKKKRSKHKHRKKKKHGRHATTRKASNAPAPAPDPNQPQPHPPAPVTDEPMLQIYTDETNELFRITSDWYGAYRGLGVAYGGFPIDSSARDQCGNAGIPGQELKITYTTLTEMLG
jgi:hypothetical protein